MSDPGIRAAGASSVPPQPRTSCLYEGTVRHRRFGEHAREFCYRLAMLYLDLDEVDTLFDPYWMWSTGRSNVATFRREDHFGDPQESLADSVRKLVRERLKCTVDGPIRLLTQPRFLGCVMNPISLYYCFCADGKTLSSIVAEVTNTPWGERHCYVIEARNSGAPPHEERPAPCSILAEHEKALHVSPFLPMGMRYRWRLTVPGELLAVHIDDYENQNLRLDATLRLQRSPITSASLAGALLRFPGMSLKVSLAIYWQALQLWLRGVPFVPHPKSDPATSGNSF